MAEMNAPRFKTDRSSDEAATFADPGATNLRTQAGRVQFGPQRLTIIPTADNGACTLTPDIGANIVFTGLAKGSPVVVNTPCRAVVSSTTAILLCEWWTAPGPGDWSPTQPITRNAP